MTTVEDRTSKPLYAVGVRVPVCEYRRVEKLQRGNWIVLPFVAGRDQSQMVHVVLKVENLGDKTYLDLAVYPDRSCVYPWHHQKHYEKGTLVHVLTGEVE